MGRAAVRSTVITLGNHEMPVNTSRCVINDLDEYAYIYSEIPVPAGASCLLHVHTEVKSEFDVKIRYY